MTIEAAEHDPCVVFQCGLDACRHMMKV